MTGDEELSIIALEMNKIKEKVNNIDALVQTFENNTDDMAIEIRDFERDIQKLNMEKPVLNPGDKMKDLLDKWSFEDI